MVWCNVCKTARMDDPKLFYCPSCGGPLTAPPIPADSSPAALATSVVIVPLTASPALSSSEDGLDDETPSPPPPPSPSPVVTDSVRTRGQEPRMLTYNGKTQTIAAWARELGLSSATIYDRLKAGQNTERALRSAYGRKERGWTGIPASGIPLRTVTLPATPSNVVLAEELNTEVPGAIVIAELEAAPKTAAESIVEIKIETPPHVQALRDYCARLDEIEYEIALLHDEQRRIITKLEAANGKS